MHVCVHACMCGCGVWGIQRYDCIKPEVLMYTLLFISSSGVCSPLLVKYSTIEMTATIIIINDCNGKLWATQFDGVAAAGVLRAQSLDDGHHERSGRAAPGAGAEAEPQVWDWGPVQDPRTGRQRPQALQLPPGSQPHGSDWSAGESSGGGWEQGDAGVCHVMYFFISFKGKRGCLTWVTNNSEIKFTCIKEIQSKSAQYELIPQASFK